MAPALEFWFEFGSPYSYPSVMRIEDDAARHGDIQVLWRPFLLGPIFKSLGWSTSPFLVEKERGAYMWKDMARQCRKYAIPWAQPTTFPRIALLPMRVALLGAERPWMGEYCKQIMMQNFAFDRDIDDETVVGEVLDALGLPAGDIMAEARCEPTKQRLRQQTEVARSRGVFGAPTFFTGDEMFWGNDRLDDALAFLSERGTR